MEEETFAEEAQEETVSVEETIPQETETAIIVDIEEAQMVQQNGKLIVKENKEITMCERKWEDTVEEREEKNYYRRHTGQTKEIIEE